MVTNKGKKVAGFATDFRNFIMRGNVVDFAVAVIIGGAFGRIIESFVGDIITPVILNCDYSPNSSNRIKIDYQ